MLILDNIPALLVAIPLLASAVVSLLPSARIAWGFAFVTTLICLYMAFELVGIISSTQALSYAFGGWEPPWGIVFVLDSANVYLVLLVAFVSVIATLYAYTMLAREIAVEDLPKAYAVWLLAIASLFGLAMTGDAFNLFVFLEISALSSITLIALGAGQDRRALLAAYNYLIIGAIGATFYVIGVGYLYAATGSLNLIDITDRLNELGTNQAAITGLAFMLAGIMVKAGVFPVHIWLPAAYSYAPSAVSSLLAAVATKVAIYYFARLLFGIFIDITQLVDFFLLYILMPVSVLAIFYGTIAAIYQSDFKRLFALSSIAQIGYITFAFSLNSHSGISAGFIHIINHALIKGALFMVVGIFALGIGSRATMSSMQGVGRQMPITFAGFVLAGLALIGVPLTAGFISKLYLFKAIFETGNGFYVALIALSSVLSVLYLWKIFEVMWLKEPVQPLKIDKEPASAYLPVWLMVGVIMIFGVYSGEVISSGIGAANALIGAR